MSTDLTRVTYKLILDDLGVVAEQQADGGLAELGHAGDLRVLLVQVFGGEQLLGTLHALEHVRLAVVVTVGAHAEVDLLRVGVALEGVSHAEDGIWRRHLHIRPPMAKYISFIPYINICKYCILDSD